VSDRRYRLAREKEKVPPPAAGAEATLRRARTPAQPNPLPQARGR
jgi:hypothetical protein